MKKPGKNPWSARRPRAQEDVDEHPSTPGRKLSTADLATPATRTDTGEGPEGQPVGPVVAGPEARRAVKEDDASEQMPPLDARPIDTRTRP